MFQNFEPFVGYLPFHTALLSIMWSIQTLFDLDDSLFHFFEHVWSNYNLAHWMILDTQNISCFTIKFLAVPPTMQTKDLFINISTITNFLETELYWDEICSIVIACCLGVSRKLLMKSIVMISHFHSRVDRGCQNLVECLCLTLTC